MDKKIKKAWLKALRTPPDEGGYVKTRKVMHRRYEDVDSFCCLGVLANLHELMCPTEPLVDTYGRKENPFGAGIGPNSLHDWASSGNTRIGPDPTHLRHHASALARLNDDSETFEPVIDYIETHL